MDPSWMLLFLVVPLGVESHQLMNQGLVISPDVDEVLEIFGYPILKELGNTEKIDDFAILLHDVFVALKSSSFPTAVATNISQKCLEDSQFYVHSLYTNRSLWALQMQESSGQLPPGLFGSFNVQADGLFDECQAVQAPRFNGQYCKVFFKTAPVDQSELLPPESQTEEQNERSNYITLFQILGTFFGSDRVEPKLSGANSYTYLLPSISFCLPSSCSANDLGHAVAELVGIYVIANQSIVTVTDEQYCFKENNDPPPFDGATITVIVVLSVICLLVVLATTHEAWRRFFVIGFDAQLDDFKIRALHCFSALTNGRKILSMKVTVPSANDNIGCIHGIRFFSTCWVVLAHSWSFLGSKTMNPKAVLMDAYGWGMQPITNGSVAVDTFFLISGLLVSFLLLRELDNNKGKFNIGFYFLHRYLRLTIVYAFILGFVATLIVYLGTGPNWYTVTQYSNACRIAWWRNFLYINNLFPYDARYACISQSWYLAADTQLFIIAPLLVYPLWRWKKFGLAFLAFVALACHAFIFYLYARDDLPPSYFFTRPDSHTYETSDSYFNNYYYKTWTRAPPYLVGIWTGWYLHVTKHSSFRLPKLLVSLGWTLSTAVGLAVVYGLAPYVDQQEVPEISPAVKMTYGPLSRTAWACVIAWIIFACSHGYGGFINNILSWKGFLPLGRLTYCVYLIHYDYINLFYSAMRKQYYYTLFGQFTTYFGMLVIVFGLAFGISVCIEASFLNLEKLIFSWKPKSTPHGQTGAPSVTDNKKV